MAFIENVLEEFRRLDLGYSRNPRLSKLKLRAFCFIIVLFSLGLASLKACLGCLHLRGGQVKWGGVVLYGYSIWAGEQEGR